MRLARLGLCLGFCCLLIAGCHRRSVVIAPPAPPPPAMVSVPPPTHRTEPLPGIPLEEIANPELQISRRSLPRFRPLHATKAQLAGLKPLPAPIDLGQLTVGGETANTTLRQQTEDLLRSQQRRLATLPRSIVGLHTHQVQQAKLFLKQADEAWAKQDVEGTRTLSTKAKVLLDELLT